MDQNSPHSDVPPEQNSPVPISKKNPNPEAEIFKLDELSFYSITGLKFLDDEFPRLNKVIDMESSKLNPKQEKEKHQPLPNNSNTTIDLNDSALHKEHQLTELKMPQKGSISADTVRRGFIRKVLSIIMTQFAVSVGFMLLALLSEGMKSFMLKYWYIAFFMLICEFVFFISMSCYPNNCRRSPLNYILLFMFTIATAYVTAFLCVISASIVVLVAILATVFFVLGLILYIFFTDRDLTFNVAILLYLPIGAVFIIVFLSTWPGYLGNAMIGMFVLALFGMYLIYDMQKLSGKFGEEFKVDDYIIASLTIYTDIIMIFKQLILLLSGGGR